MIVSEPMLTPESLLLMRNNRYPPPSPLSKKKQKKNRYNKEKFKPERKSEKMKPSSLSDG